MIATGSPSDDAMFAILQNASGERRELYDALGLPQDRPMLLTPLPPDFLYVTKHQRTLKQFPGLFIPPV